MKYPKRMGALVPLRLVILARSAAVTAIELLQGILAGVGEQPADEDVALSGEDPVLRSPLRIGEAGAATIGAAALVAARLWTLRGGDRQSVRVDVDAAAAAMRSSRYVRVESGDGPADEAASLADFRPRAARGGTGVFRTRDGRWIYLHRAFPHHRARICSVLECADEEADLASAVKGWDALALEEAIVGAGACAAMVRSAGEWRALEQAQAVAALPLLEVDKMAETPPLPLDAAARPLAGVRVLDLTRVLAGPTCARTLAEQGADVLRVGTRRLPEDDAMLRDTGHGKRSTALDLNDAREAARLRELVRGADVFSQGYRPGAMASLGFGLEDVLALRPGIVYVQLSAFSHRGPWAARRGFDSIVQAHSGIADEHAVDGVPGFAPANPLDYMTGYLAAFGVVVALIRRAREGGSYRVRLSLAQTGRWLARQPRVDATGVAPDLEPERLGSLMMTSDTPFGRLRHLAPIAQLSETPGRWDRPAVPLDHDPPEWW
jgi:crotonobetainyl-CoA:carnitine CoA-transferase CaiB-like acyl-CoA transferase